MHNFKIESIGSPPLQSEKKSKTTAQEHVFDLTACIVSSYVANNILKKEELGELLHTTFHVLNGLYTTVSTNDMRPEPAVPIAESVVGDHIVCLEDGKKLKMLKRHLKSSYNMTPEEYKERWGLPLDYPMVAPDYAKKRSALALKIGLGVRRKTVAA